LVLLDSNKNAIASLDGYTFDIGTFSQNLGVAVQMPEDLDPHELKFYLDGNWIGTKSSLSSFDTDGNGVDLYHIGPSSFVRDKFLALDDGIGHKLYVIDTTTGWNFCADFFVMNAPSSSPSTTPTISMAPTLTIGGLILIDKDKDPISPLDNYVIDFGLISEDLGVRAMVADLNGRTVSYYLDGSSTPFFTKNDEKFDFGPSSAAETFFQELPAGEHTIEAVVTPELKSFTATFDIINAPTSAPTLMPTVSMAPTRTVDLILIDDNKDQIAILDGHTLDVGTIMDNIGLKALIPLSKNCTVSWYFDNVLVFADGKYKFDHRFGPSKESTKLLQTAFTGTHSVRVNTFPHGDSYEVDFNVTNEVILLIDKSKNPISMLDGYTIDVGLLGEDLGVRALVPDKPGRRVKFFLDGNPTPLHTVVHKDYWFGPSSAFKALFQSLSETSHTFRVEIVPDGLAYEATFNIVNAPSNSPSMAPSISMAPTVTIAGLVLIDKNENPIAALDNYELDVGALLDYVGVRAIVPDLGGRSVAFYLDGSPVPLDTIVDKDFWYGADSASLTVFHNMVTGNHTIEARVEPDGKSFEATFTVINEPRVMLIDSSQNPIALLDGYNLEVGFIYENVGIRALVPDLNGRSVSFFLDSDLTPLATIADNDFWYGPSAAVKLLFQNMAPGTHTIRADVTPDGKSKTATFEVTNAGLMLLDGSLIPIMPLDGAELDLNELGVDLAIRALMPEVVGRTVSFHFGNTHANSDDTHDYRLGPSATVEAFFQNVGIGTHTIRATVFDDKQQIKAIQATFNITNLPPPPIRERLRQLESSGQKTSGSLISAILKSNFTGASGPVSFGRENPNGRNSDGITVGIYNVRPQETEPGSGNSTFESVLVSTWNERDGWDNAPHSGLVYRDGSTIPTGVLRRVFYHNYISFSVRIIGLSLMGFAWVLALVLIVLLGWLRKDTAVQSAQPLFMQIMCFGAILTSAAIFTLSWDEDAGWTNEQLSIACSLTPWFFFTGHILIFCSLFIKLWRVDHVLRRKKTAVTVYKAMWPLAAFLLVTFLLLLAQSIYDPWSWERHIITEIPAETYGKCQSKNEWSFFGPLVGLIFAAEAATLYFAWRASNITSKDFQDSQAIMYACLAQIQAWTLGVPLLAALGYSSADATYFARIFLTWIFSVSSVTVVVCPRVLRALRMRYNPELANKQQRVRIGASNGSNEGSGSMESSMKLSSFLKKNTFRYSWKLSSLEVGLGESNDTTALPTPTSSLQGSSSALSEQMSSTRELTETE